MTQHNAAVIKMVTDRYSAHVRAFNHLPGVTEEDSDNQYWLNKELQSLAEAAFARAPEFKPSGNRMALLLSADLGNAYRVLRNNLTDRERARYNAIKADLEALSAKYEG